MLVAFEVLSEMPMNSTILWVVKLCSWEKPQCFGGTTYSLFLLDYCFNLKDRRYFPPKLWAVSELPSITMQKTILVGVFAFSLSSARATK